MCRAAWGSSASRRARHRALAVPAGGLACAADRFPCLNEVFGTSAAVCPSLRLLLGPGGTAHVELHSLVLQLLLTVIF